MKAVLRWLGRGLLVVVALVATLSIAVAIFLWVDEPTPVEALLDKDAAFAMADWDGSDPADPDAPSVLVLGSPHLAQLSEAPDEAELEAMHESLAPFDPDLVAVEHLPPDWPVGEGRDYRPGFELERYADRWDFPRDEAEAVVREARARPEAIREEMDPCRLGRAYFLARDLVNAHYQWRSRDCEPQVDEEAFTQWWASSTDHEMARIGYPVARAAGVHELTSFDDQSPDAGWFLYREAFTWEAWTSPRDLWQMLPLLNPATRELSQYTEDADGLIERLRLRNAPEQIALQYWTYERRMPTIDVRNDVGERQRDAYWRRNERMFARLQEAIEAREAERVLVIVGAGRKWFLDRLVREAGHRWVDPRTYLPRGRDGVRGLAGALGIGVRRPAQAPPAAVRSPARTATNASTRSYPPSDTSTGTTVGANPTSRMAGARSTSVMSS